MKRHNHLWVAVIIVVLVLVAVFVYSNTVRDDLADDSNTTQDTNEQAMNETYQQGVDFLQSNAERQEITTTDSGLQYEVLNQTESGESPAASSTVTVHYHGTTIDGTVFDSSRERGEPISFPLNRVIEGWQEGLQLMTVGDTFKFYIPSELAYGEASPSPLIPANSVLIFEVELLGIN